MTGRAALLVGLIGCADSRFGSKGGTSSTDTDPSDTYTTDSGASTPPEVSPELQHFDARFDLVGGVPQLATSTLAVTLHAADGTALCSYDLPLVAVAEESRPERALFAWWRVEAADGVPLDDGGCGEHPASTLWMGVGPYDTALDPASLAAGYDGATAASAVLRLGPGEPVWLAGLAGSEDQLEGYAPAPTTRPLPDGALWWVGLILLPW